MAMQLPVGYSDFGEIREKRLSFVDKTLLIKEILDDVTTKIAVITRPRRFGKTLNLSMLHYFLASEVIGRPTKGLFDGLKITECGETYMRHQGKYPVVFITFKDVKASQYGSAYEHITQLLSSVYRQHSELLTSDFLDKQQKKQIELILAQGANEAIVKTALLDLCECIYLHHKVKPWLLIDEYDTPIQAAYLSKYYPEMIGLMRSLLGTALKDNPYLDKAVITGITRVSKESLFSGVNNLKTYSVLNKKYSEYFGFTEKEMEMILQRSELSSRGEQIKSWYNGYVFGGTVIYNPWSIANCLSEEGETKPYWVNTSDNQLIKDLVKQSPLKFKTQFESLVKGEGIEQLLDENLVFQYLNHNPTAVWSLLLMTGYLNAEQVRDTDQGPVVRLTIPNREVKNLYRQVIEQWLSNGYGVWWYNEFIESLLNGKMTEFQRDLEKVLLQIASYHDMAKEPEAFYQGLLLGVTVSIQDRYEILPNRESGLGRADLILIPKDKHQRGIVLEFKVADSVENLKKAAEEALAQIKAKRYAASLEAKGITQVLSIGIGFIGKELAIAFEEKKN